MTKGSKPRSTKKNPQEAATRKMAAAMRRTYRQTKSLRETARIHNVLTKGGKANPGMAYHIMFEDYEPRNPELRERIGLPPLAHCLSCGRRAKAKPNAREWHWYNLIELSPQQIAYLIENRTRMG